MANEQVLKQLSLIPDNIYGKAGLNISFDGQTIFTKNGLFGFLPVEKVQLIDWSGLALRIFFPTFHLCFSDCIGFWELYFD